jgi:PAS domain S-box-containing protein
MQRYGVPFRLTQKRTLKLSETIDPKVGIRLEYPKPRSLVMMLQEFPVERNISRRLSWPSEVIVSRKISSKTPMLTVGILFVLAVVLANAVVSYRGARLLARNNRAVVHTFRVIDELQDTLSLAKDAETGYRGYVLTGDPKYLEPYSHASNEIWGHIEKFAELSRDNPEQQRRLPILRQLVQDKLDIARNVVVLQRKGEHRAAVSAINNNSGMETMNRIRQLIAEMRGDEERLLEVRRDQSRQVLRDAMLALLLASLVAFVFVVAFYLLARREIKERVRTAVAVQDRESWLDTILSSIGDGVVALDATGRVTYVNRVAERLLACTGQDCNGKTIAGVFTIFDELTGAPAHDRVENAMARGVKELGEHIVLRNRKNEEIPIEDSVAPIIGGEGKVIGTVLVFRDVTTKRMAQESARRSEKLAATGRLAATIAHEINNPLEAATNLIYLAKHSLARGEDTAPYLESLEHQISRAAHITQKTLSFHRDSSRPVVVNMASLVEEIVAIYSGRIRSKHIRLKIDCPEDLELVTLRGEIVQITSNLIANAIDALDTGGFLGITVKSESEGVKFEVHDSGTGIPTQYMNRIFEPFFTTKTDVGTGLGLWVVKDLIEKQGGTISVASPCPGSQKGACFSVFLPPLGVGSVREEKAS